jgi:hypothetical protein
MHEIDTIASQEAVEARVFRLPKNAPKSEKAKIARDMRLHTEDRLKQDFGGKLTAKNRTHIAKGLSKNFLYLIGKQHHRINSDSSLFNFADKRDDFMDRFAADGVTEDEFLAGACISSAIFLYDMMQASQRVQNITDHFAPEKLQRGPYVRAALKSTPPVLALNDMRVIQRLEGPMHIYADDGLERASYIRMVLKNIRIAGTALKKTCTGIDYLLAMVDMGICPLTEKQLKEAEGSPHRCVFDHLEGAPSRLSYSPQNYILRMDWAMRGNENYEGFGVFKRPMRDLMTLYQNNMQEPFSLENVARDNMKLYFELTKRKLWPQSEELAEGGQPQPSPLIAV